MQQTFKGKEDDHKEEEELGIWDCGSPLYDSYELVSVSHLIERHLMALPPLGGSRRFNFSQYSSHELASLGAKSDMRSRSNTMEGKGSNSVVGGLSEFLGIRKIWKRKFGFGERKDRSRKMKTELSGFCNIIGLWRQKDQHR